MAPLFYLSIITYLPTAHAQPTNHLPSSHLSQLNQLTTHHTARTAYAVSATLQERIPTHASPTPLPFPDKSTKTPRPAPACPLACLPAHAYLPPSQRHVFSRWF
ncbi:hypothetical protein IWX49DRAFT_569162 [Phyllosticta citricarpa]